MDWKYVLAIALLFTIAVSVFIYRDSINDAIVKKALPDKKVRFSDKSEDSSKLASSSSEDYYDEIDDLINSIYMKQLWCL